MCVCVCESKLVFGSLSYNSNLRSSVYLMTLSQFRLESVFRSSSLSTLVCPEKQRPAMTRIMELAASLEPWTHL